MSRFSAIQKLLGSRAVQKTEQELVEDAIPKLEGRVEREVFETPQSLLDGRVEAPAVPPQAMLPAPTEATSNTLRNILLGSAGIGGAGLIGYGLSGDSSEKSLPPIPLRNDYVAEEPVKEEKVEPVVAKKPAMKAASAVPAKVEAAPAEDLSKVIDFGDNVKDTEAALRAAQDRQNSAFLGARLGGAADMIGSAIAGVKPMAQDAFAQSAKDSEQIVAQHKERMEKAKDDPNSAMSIGLRKQLESMGYKIKGNASASDLIKILPGLESLYKGQEDRAIRKEDLNERREDRRNAAAERNEERKLRREEMGFNRNLKISEKEDQFTEKQRQALGKQIADSGLSTMVDKIEGIEAQLGMSIEEAIKKGAEVEGYGRLDGSRPQWSLGDNGVKMRQLVNSLSNVELKKRSGAAVSNQEFARFKEEFGSGNFVPDKTLLLGLANLKRGVDTDLNTIRSSYRPEATQRFEEDYGSNLLSRNSATKKTTTDVPAGKVKVSNGKETLFVDEADLAAAEKDNYKRVK